MGLRAIVASHRARSAALNQAKPESALFVKHELAGASGTIMKPAGGAGDAEYFVQAA
jgi:hypothetical protein